MTSSNWWADPNKVLSFARYLENEHHFNKPIDLLRYFEKPWNWTTEYNQFLAEVVEARDAKV